MAYFAEIDSNGTVLRVISVSNDDAPDPAPSHSEPLGQHFISETLGLPGTWVQTSFNGTFRRRYAAPGFTFDAERSVFVTPRPAVSWTLDAAGDWQPPTPYPSEGGPWEWDEDTLSWVEITA